MNTLTIKTLEVAGLYPALTSVYLSFGKEAKTKYTNEITTTHIDTDDAGAITGLDVSLITNGHIDLKDIRLLTKLINRGDEHAKVLRGIQVWADITAPIYWWYEMETYRIGHERLMSESTMHTEGKGLSGEELQKVKGAIPMGHLHRKVDVFSYQTLRRICRQRDGHRLPEWAEFIRWAKTLPFAKQLIFGEDYE